MTRASRGRLDLPSHAAEGGAFRLKTVLEVARKRAPLAQPWLLFLSSG